MWVGLMGAAGMASRTPDPSAQVSVQRDGGDGWVGD